MSSMPAVIVKKGGFLSSLAVGFFTCITTTVICGSVLGLYGMHIMNTKASQILSFGSGVIEKLPEWQKALPPAVAEAIHDRRAPEYRENVKVSVEATPGRRADRGRVVVEVKNNGNEAISLLALRLVLEGGDGSPVGDMGTYAATPIMVDGEWRGPILPGSTRRFVREYWEHDSVTRASYEITELRVWQPSDATTNAEPAGATTAQR
ncbi:MAG: hypothetical protein U1D55_10645 [Phycisphaerae bacterium]